MDLRRHESEARTDLGSFLDFSGCERTEARTEARTDRGQRINGSFLDFLGLANSSRYDGGDVVASLVVSAETIGRLVELAERLSVQGTASLVAFLKLAYKVCLAHTAVMGRFGRAAVRPIYELIAVGGGAFPRAVKGGRRWWGLALPAIAPRLITSAAQKNDFAPIRIYSAATAGGVFSKH